MLITEADFGLFTSIVPWRTHFDENSVFFSVLVAFFQKWNLNSNFIVFIYSNYCESDQKTELVKKILFLEEEVNSWWVMGRGASTTQTWIYNELQPLYRKYDQKKSQIFYFCNHSWKKKHLQHLKHRSKYDQSKTFCKTINIWYLKITNPAAMAEDPLISSLKGHGKNLSRRASAPACWWHKGSGEKNTAWLCSWDHEKVIVTLTVKVRTLPSFHW